MFCRRKNPQLLFRVNGHRMVLLHPYGSCKRSTLFNIYVKLCLSFFCVFGSAPKTGGWHGVWRTVWADQKNRPPMVQSTQTNKLNETIKVWNAVFTASVTFESHNSLNVGADVQGKGTRLTVHWRHWDPGRHRSWNVLRPALHFYFEILQRIR